MTLKRLLINLLIILGLIGILSFAFFYELLPFITNKDDIVTVPDVRGMSLDEGIHFLKSKSLDFVVTDSTYNLDQSPLAIQEQHPRPNSKVKINRKINLVINAKNPPNVLFPSLNGLSFDFAQKQLKMLDLKLGAIQYRADIAHNAILESKANGITILPGQRIPKGTIIDLIIGSPNVKFPLPDLHEMELADVETLIAGLNLKIARYHHVKDDNKKENTIQGQLPHAGDTVRHGDEIELWVYNLSRKD